MHILVTYISEWMLIYIGKGDWNSQSLIWILF
jgi:hypothetical protein